LALRGVTLLSTLSVAVVVAGALVSVVVLMVVSS
jgi:hypothetical protein